MLNNKLLALVGSKSRDSQVLPYTLVWSAFNSLKQENYLHKGSIPNVGLALVSETNYEVGGDDSILRPPHLCFPLQAPNVIDELDPARVRLDVFPVLEIGANAMYIEENPGIKYPVKENEYFSITLEANFMILLPESEIKTESIQPIFKWQPEPSAYESIVARYLRNDLGETSVDITHFRADGSSTSTKFDFDQFVLNEPRMFFNMVVEPDKITVTVNGKYSGSLPFSTSVEGEGHFVILYPELDEQGANIAEVYRVSLSRFIQEL